MWYWTIRERRGVLVLVVLIFLLRFIHFFWPHFSEEVEIEIQDLAKNNHWMKSDSSVTAEVVQRPLSVVQPQQKIKQVPVQRKVPLKIGVNTSLAEDWMKIRGIGPVLSNRIIKFREALGGFCNVEQVGQTYGIPDSVFQDFKRYLYLDQPCNQLNINEMDWQQLVRHPYIDSRQANAILKFIENRGPIEDLQLLRQMEIFDSASWEQLAPYLKTNN